MIPTHAQRDTLKRPLLLLIFFALGVFWLLHIFALPWSQDEGLYLIVARRMTGNETIYRDFAFQQMPLYAYFLATWDTLIGTSLIGVRLFSLLCVALLLRSAYLLLRKPGIPSWLSVSFGILILTHPLSWRYLPLVKPHAVSLGATLLGWSFYERSRSSSKQSAIPLLLLSGLSFGVATNTRWIFIIAPFLAVLFLRKEIKAQALLLIGLLVPSLSSIFNLIRFPDQVLFSWLHYHRLRGGVETLEAWVVQGKSILLAFSDFAWIFPLALLGVVIYLRIKKEMLSWKLGLPLFLLAAFLTLPTFRLFPLYDEYVLPVLVFGLLGLFRIAGHTRTFQGASLICALLSVLLFLPSVVADLQLIADRSREPWYGQRNVIQVGQAVERHTKPNDEVLFWWNAFYWISNRKVMPGMGEGHAVRTMRGKLTPEESKRYHIAREEEVIAWIQKGRPKLIAASRAAPRGFERVVRKHYAFLEEVGGVSLYARRPSRP